MMKIDLVNTDSDHILQLIESGTRGAEIGVWMGSSSEKFVKKKLTKLYLVDPYSLDGYLPARNANDPTHDEKEFYKRYADMVGGTDEASFKKYYDGVHETVVNKFSKYPEVEVIRKTSTEFFNEFSDEKLDWIYIDGDHSYTGVKNDLNNCLKILKPGGLIIGDDYKWGKDSDKGGVKKAVNEFVNKNNLRLNMHGSLQYSMRLK